MTDAEMFAFEAACLIPFFYFTKLWHAHCEFMEDMIYAIPR